MTLMQTAQSLLLMQMEDKVKSVSKQEQQEKELQ